MNGILEKDMPEEMMNGKVVSVGNMIYLRWRSFLWAEIPSTDSDTGTPRKLRSRLVLFLRGLWGVPDFRKAFLLGQQYFSESAFGDLKDDQQEAEDISYEDDLFSSKPLEAAYAWSLLCQSYKHASLKFGKDFLIQARRFVFGRLFRGSSSKCDGRPNGVG